jgi:hypothetical protein
MTMSVLTVLLLSSFSAIPVTHALSYATMMSSGGSSAAAPQHGGGATPMPTLGRKCFGLKNGGILEYTGLSTKTPYAFLMPSVPKNRASFEHPNAGKYPYN